MDDNSESNYREESFMIVDRVEGDDGTNLTGFDQMFKRKLTMLGRSKT